MTNEIHPRVADINARIAAGENLTDLDSQYLDMIGNGYSPEEADKLVPTNPSLADMMTELVRLRREVKADPEKRAELLKLRDHIRLLDNRPVYFGTARRPGATTLTRDLRAVTADEPGELQQMLNSGHVPEFMYSTKHLDATDPCEGVTPKITDEDWADLTMAEAERLVSAGRAIIRGGRLLPIEPNTPECEAARFLGMDDLLTHSIRGRAEDINPGLIHKLQDDGIDDFFSSLSREADAEVTFHTVKLKVTTRYAKVKAKKGPRTVRTYRLPPKASLLDVSRGKHRGHLPTNQCGSRLYMMGKFSADTLTASERILATAREATLKSLALTPEQIAEKREVFGRKPGWVRKQVAGKLDNPMSGVPVRNPLPLEMTARYTGHIQLEDRVRGTDKWSGRSIEGTVNSIAINDGVETLIGIVTGDGTQYEAPLSEVTKL